MTIDHKFPKPDNIKHNPKKSYKSSVNSRVCSQSTSIFLLVALFFFKAIVLFNASFATEVWLDLNTKNYVSFSRVLHHKGMESLTDDESLHTYRTVELSLITEEGILR